MFSKKSILARLLANENISVVQGNFTTASFNVETRQLQLPIWKEMSSDVYDLLVGHEVAHALWTPRENLAVEGVPFSFVNVVEDIRIEKLVLKKYPGLVSNFSRGYLDLIERDLFGTKDVDINTMAFMDRLNLKAKGRSHVDAEFSEEEKFYFDLAMSVETFEDVKIAVLKIAEWLSANQDENGLNEVISDSHYSPEGEESEQGEAYRPSEEKSDNLDEVPDSTESEESSEGTEESGDSERESEQGSEEPSDDEAEKDKDTEEESDDLGTKNKNSDSTGPAGLAEVSTDVAQQNNQVDLVDQSSLYVQSMDRAGFNEIFVPYSKVLELRKAHQGVGVSLDLPEGRTYGDFLRESKPIVNMMVKEFEMRKTAYRTLRAKTSNKGTLDVNKLHSYKYNDHLFKQISTLADSKNHGMIMLIDFSGSMNYVLSAVIKQTINLVQFCKRVNIPFQVCAFTAGHDYPSRSAALSSRKGDTLSKFDYESMCLLELFNNKMSKRDFEYAMESFFARTKVWWNHSDIETLGSTPLNAALMATQFLIEDFNKTNRVEKLNLVTLTDGESDAFSIREGADYDFETARQNSHIIIKGKRIDCGGIYNSWRTSHAVTKRILSAVAGKNVKTINYFIADRNQLRGIYQRDIIGSNRYFEFDGKDENFIRKIRKAARSEGVYVNDKKDCSGYDRQFIMINDSRRLVAEVEELALPDNATTRQIGKAFSKFGDSKKKSRIVTQKFAEIVA